MPKKAELPEMGRVNTREVEPFGHLLHLQFLIIST